ncbi:MAG: tRNA glutamyl-Q(34) synthetase GluQRS [Sinobacteraceae bacterium]|nr:tRNA glutamyl-Q(34) synthetase GluQRS [Nevskiaceae bacterium]
MGLVGRFAPSPTGDLHYGSLVAAVGSWLDAKSSPDGRWLLRIDDLDTARVRADSEASILATLKACGFDWPCPIWRQSTRLQRYHESLERLRQRIPLFRCQCSRRQLAAEGEACCVGRCRQLPCDPRDSALRADLSGLDPMLIFDRSLGEVRFDPARHSDVIVCRRDGVFAYQFAVVIDDADQGVTDVVRGADLLDSTAWQLGLSQALGLPAPRYMHLPVVVEADGQKLAKSRHSVCVRDGHVAGHRVASERIATQLRRVLQDLGQRALPAGIHDPREILQIAATVWQPERFKGKREIRLPPQA